MLGQTEVTAVLGKFVCVRWVYDGLGGTVIRWTKEHGNTNDDPAILAYVLDPKGEMLAKGDAGILSTSQALVKWLTKQSAASFPLVDVKDFPNLKRLAAAARRRLGKVLAELRKRADGDDAAADEAKMLKEKLVAYAVWKRERVMALRDKLPIAAYDLQVEIAREFAGDEIGVQAKAASDEMKKDPKFQAEIKARVALDKVLAYRDKCRPCRSGQPLDLAKCKKCRAKNKGIYDRLLVALKKVDKYFPDTVAGREAVRLVEELQMPSADKGVEKK